MTRLITFNELRQIKAQLPEGSIHRIAKELNLDVATVRNFLIVKDVLLLIIWKLVILLYLMII